MLKRSHTLLAFMCLVLVGSGGCRKAPRAAVGKTTEPGQRKIDACTLLTKQEIETLQGSQITDTKRSENPGGDFQISQCFYTAAEFNKSVNLAIAQTNPTNPQSRTPRQFWQETFGRAGEKNEKREEEEEEKERRTPPKKIEGVGDDAYWAPNRFGGVLYVLKGDSFISISVGGTDNEQTKIDKCKALAQKVIGRM
jgi:hypothetical protein